MNLPATSALSLLLCLSAAATDWPSWRGVNRDGITPETNWSHEWPADGPARVWKANVGTGFASMVVADGRLFTLGWAAEQDVVGCLDSAPGRTNWIFAYAGKLGNKMYEGGPNSTPLVAGERLFTVSKTGNLHCFETTTGKLLWNRNLRQDIDAKISDWGVSGAPVLADANTLLVNYGRHGVALDPASGNVLWKSGTKKDMSFAAPVVTRLGDSPAALFIMSKALVAVDPKTGQALWESKFGQGYRTHCSNPVVNGDLVFISSGDGGGELLRVSAKSAERVWKNKNLSTFTGTAVLIGGHLYGHETAGYKTANQELRCVDFATGEVKWGEGGFGEGSVIAAGDRLILLSDKGELSVVRATPAKFELLARTQAIGGKCWTAPVLANRRIDVRNAKGEVACFDVGAGKSANL